MKNIMIRMILFYRTHISPNKGKKVCRFYPTCSMYAIQALTKYGFLRGSWKAIKRILKCHPFHKGGYDPLI